MKTIHYFAINGTKEQSALAFGILDLAKAENTCEKAMTNMRTDDEQQTDLYKTHETLSRVRDLMAGKLKLARMLGMECAEVMLNYKQYVGESIIS